MEAPLHKLCGTRHWSTQPCPAQASEVRASSATRKGKLTNAGGKDDLTGPTATRMETATAPRPGSGPLRQQGYSPASSVERGAPKSIGIIAHGKSSLTAAITKVLSENPSIIDSGQHATPPEKRRGRPLSPNPKSPRAAYQRDLMRKRRSKDKPNG